MAHLRGNQWRESRRALDKKSRAKAKHFNVESNAGNIEDFTFIDESNEPKGIVIGSALGRITLLADKQQCEVSVSQEAPKQLASVVVPGDIVSLSRADDPPEVTGLLERRNVLSRMRRDATRRSYVGAREQIIAANIDVAAIVASAQNPPLHPRFIDRYMILIQHNDITPIICLNKADLATTEEREVLDEYRRLGIFALETSTVDHEGIDTLKDLLRDKTAVLVGQSGVGKTSLINTLDPTAGYRTGEVSSQTGKGKHTTTKSTLHVWEEDSYIIDTPGIRSLEIWDIDRLELKYYYPEFETYALNCKYPNCLHANEPIENCAVKQAVGQPNGVSEGRYESYIKILDEL